MDYKRMGVLLFLSIFIVISFSLAQNEESGAITQGDFAKILADRLNLRPPQDTPAEYSLILEQKGIRPSEGWSMGKTLTREDLANILTSAGRLQAEVSAWKDSFSVLKDRGIILPAEVDKSAVEKLLTDPSITLLLEAPSLLESGPSIPYPKKEPDATATPSPLEPPPERIGEGAATETTAVTATPAPITIVPATGGESTEKPFVPVMEPPPSTEPPPTESLAAEPLAAEPPAAEPPPTELPPTEPPPTTEPTNPSGGGSQ